MGWADSTYVLSNEVVYAITFSFFIGCVLNPIWMFREATGIFRQVRYSMAIAAFINIVLSILLGLTVGLPGIIVAPALAKIMTKFWFEPKVLYNEVFKTKLSNYWLYFGKLFLISLICFISSLVLDYFLPHSIPFMIIEIMISLFVTTLVFFLINFKSQEYTYVRQLATNLLSRRNKDKLDNIKTK